MYLPERMSDHSPLTRLVSHALLSPLLIFRHELRSGVQETGRQPLIQQWSSCSIHQVQRSRIAPRPATLSIWG